MYNSGLMMVMVERKNSKLAIISIECADFVEHYGMIHKPSIYPHENISIHPSIIKQVSLSIHPSFEVVNNTHLRVFRGE
jgi:hypothetical protein